jgi:AraC family transcriptional regulator
MNRATLAAHDARLSRAHAHLAAHLDEPPDHATLARLAGVSPRQFERVFVRLFGETPRACLRRLRLERAADRLRRGRSPILPLALAAGFASHEAFSRSFKRHFGHTPAAYRALPRVGQPPHARQAFWQLAFATGLRRHVEQAPRTEP